MNTAISFHDGQVDRFAARYHHSRAFRERFACWKTLLDQYVQPHDAVMDLGCGTGIFTRYLAEKGCFMTGIDGSEAMIAHCRRQARSVREQYGRHTLPFDTLTDYPLQDVVLLSSVLEYVPDYETVLRQVHELLRPGGLLFVSVPNRRSLYCRLETVVFSLTDRRVYRRFSRHAFAAEAFSTQLVNLNFSPLETHYYGGQRWLMPVLRLFLSRKFTDTLVVGVYRKNPLPYPPVHENYQHRRHPAKHSEGSRPAPGFPETSTR